MLSDEQVAELRRLDESDDDRVIARAFLNAKDSLLSAHADAVRLKKAIENEPEFPDEMPDEMWEMLSNDREALTDAFRETVRAMKRNILAAALRPAGQGGGA